MRDWYIDCALAFQASEMGLIPISRSRACVRSLLTANVSVRRDRQGERSAQI